MIREDGIVFSIIREDGIVPILSDWCVKKTDTHKSEILARLSL